MNDGSCVRLRPECRDHVWSYDFVHHRTDDGKVFRALNILDEHSRECLAIQVKRKPNSTDVIDAPTDLFILRGVPAFIRSDNGPEFVAETVRNWIKAVGAKTAYIKPGSPWENGYCESFNARFRDEPPRENQTIYAGLGDIIYAREWPEVRDYTGFEAIAMFYGAETVRDWRGTFAVNHIGRLDPSQWELVQEIGNRIYRHGGEDCTIRVLED